MDRCMAGTALDSTRSIFSYGHDEMRCLFLNKTLSNKANMEGEDDWVRLKCRSLHLKLFEGGGTRLYPIELQMSTVRS